MTHSLLRKLSLITILAVSTTVLLSGCVPKEFQPLPTKERYQYINAVKDTVDVQATGEILTEEYDENGGVISPSYYKVIINGLEPYETIKVRLFSISNMDCRENERQANCIGNHVQIFLYKIEKTQTTELQIHDSSNGRGVL